MNDGVWISVSEVAAARGVSKQAVHQRLKKLNGKVSTKTEGRQMLMNIAEYDRAVDADTDPAQALRNRDSDSKIGSSVKFADERAKRESYEAELARLKLEEQLGKLIPIAEVEQAMVRLAERLLRSIEQWPSMSDDVAVRKVLKEKVLEARGILASDMRLLRDGDLVEDEA